MDGLVQRTRLKDKKMGCLIIEKRPREGISGKTGFFPLYTDVQPKEPDCTLYPACLDEIDNNAQLSKLSMIMYKLAGVSICQIKTPEKFQSENKSISCMEAIVA